MFNSYILNADLVDLSYGGWQFTWANKRTRGDCIATKIDRVLVNESWLDHFPASTAMFLPSGISDHSPVVVSVSVKAPSFKKPFKFFDFWAKHEEFLPKVAQDWSQYIHGVPMYRVCKKLRSLKPVLKTLNTEEFSDISPRVLVTKADLDAIQWKLDKDPSNQSLQNLERNIHKKYVDLSVVEESLAHQKSRVQWLGLGDRNSSFFFRSVKGNINRGKILKVEMEDGSISIFMMLLSNISRSFLAIHLRISIEGLIESIPLFVLKSLMTKPFNLPNPYLIKRSRMFFGL
ncbi:hypothetical protein ACSBR1_023830 [Camellia fascicularis]